ncbi:protein SMAX1-LIKE 3-like [Impatiens glandulifera]|uniref:protein SMAX1-LIKE 3-like n=1 Tax=Impatiens glandulifera TaxID=253017 RepID=UPI001FB0C4C3|nr:protein SMAX1-LIKE 3-like [Impatiens glandulifera]
MRTAASYSVHQGLTSDAAAIVKSAITLARRRGHAQVTPLHVATAMMGAANGLLRAACLRAHSHPLQCKALELCFNVSLNRLPTSASNPLVILGPSNHNHNHHHHNHHPSFSNALVAAFKRAQAHQRRGSVENQQQPILALKIELEQLVISILDDPSVSRVMREAGFSSPQVKKNVEQAVSLEITSSSSHINHSLVIKTEPKETIKPLFQFTLNKSNDLQASEDDVNSILDSLTLTGTTKLRNTVIVAENLTNAECLMRGVMGKLDRGDVRFVSVPLWSFRNMAIEDVQHRIGELRCLVNGYESKWVVLYLGDLKWVSQFWSNYGEERRNHYSPVELMIMELSRLLCGGVGEKGKKLWLMGIADFNTFTRCKIGHPSLETLWQLHPLTVPVGSLGLTLNLESHDLAGVEKNLNCCSDCRVNYKREAWNIEMGNACQSFSSLPSWLKIYKEDQNKRKAISDQDFEKLKELCKKWNSICRSVHKKPHFLESAQILSSSSPSSSSSVSAHDQNMIRLHQTAISTWPLIKQKPELLSNPNSSPNSASCSEANDEEDNSYAHSFKDFNSENLKALSKGLEKKVPWHKDIIPDISSTILESRSGMVRRKASNTLKEETWLSFLGVDQNGKEMIGKEVARIVFGSYDNYVSIGVSGGYSDCMKNKKRMREDQPGSSYLDRFAEAVKENPSRVFFMEDVEKVDYSSQLGIKKAIENGKVSVSDDGEFVPLKDAIVILSCGSFSSLSRPCSPQRGENDGLCGPLDLNVGATEDDDHDHDNSVNSIGFIMDIIDRQIIFKIQVL